MARSESASWSSLKRLVSVTSSWIDLKDIA